ncbi:MAG: ATP-binding protein, partial [Desulfobacterales bacterium]|nr:ATP-binding protein [Desulfobacterales bacterium]
MTTKNKIRTSIAKKFVFYILIFSSFAAFISTSIQLFFEYERDLSAIEETADQIEKSHKSTIAKALWAYDMVIIESQLQGIKNLPGILYVSIKKDNKIFNEIGTKYPNLKSISYTYPLSHIVKNKQLELGNLEVLVNLSEVYERLWDRITIIFLTQISKTFFVSIFIFFLFYILVGRHLKSMAIFAESANFTNMDDELILNRENSILDELSIVETALNNMRRRLINEVKKVENSQQDLKKSEERFKAIYEHAPVLINAFDEKGRCILWNNECRRIFGWTIEEINAHDDAFSLFYPDPIVKEEAIRTVTTDPEAKFKEWNPVTKDGKSLHTMWTNFKLPDGLTYNLGYDITGQKVAEEQKQKLQEKLYQAQKMESIGQLAGGIAHDFNNILYPILGFTQMVMDDLPKGHKVQEDLKNILDGANRARDLVKRILLFSRQEKPELKPTILQPVIKETQKLLRSTIPSNIDLITNFYDGQDQVLCDESEIHEIILNLCTNAYHAIPGDQGEIVVDLDKLDPPGNLNLPRGEYLCLSVRDNGVGIPEKIKDKIFEPYMTTKGVGKGSGLGLSVVYGIVQDYNGGINVESTPQKGTIFRIFLPISLEATT